MWFNIVKLKKNYLLHSLTEKDLKKKKSLFNEKKITEIFKLLVSVKGFLFSYAYKSNIHDVMFFYINIKNISLRANTKKFNTVLQLKNTKKQLFCTLFNKNKILMFISGGFFLKKLSLKKHQKKDNKVSILLIKHIIEVLQKKKIANLVVSVLYAKNIALKYIHFLKNNLKNTNTLYFYSPKLHFSKKRYKKIQSIKRKLKKKYVYEV